MIRWSISCATWCFLSLLCTSLQAKTVEVNNGKALQKALAAAQAGDTILLGEGDYSDAKQSNTKRYKSYYVLANSGKPGAPITLKSKSREKLQSLYGDASKGYSGYVMYITGDHWIVKDLIVHSAKKGIMLDSANHNVLDNIEVHSIGEEGVHFRKASSNNILKNCWIHHTGKIPDREGYGEGIYVGSHNGNKPGKEDYSRDNRIGGCVIGPGVTAEGMDIKEGTEGTIVENNWFDGEGVSGKNWADSFIDVKGNTVTIRGNEMRDAGNKQITRGIHFLKDKTHQKSWVYDNVATMLKTSTFIRVDGGTVHQQDNVINKSRKGVASAKNSGKLDKKVDKKTLPKSEHYPGYSKFTEAQFDNFLKGMVYPSR